MASIYWQQNYINLASGCLKQDAFSPRSHQLNQIAHDEKHHDLIYSFLTNYDITLDTTANKVDNNPVILCLHGWLDNAASFTPLAEYLTDYKLIAIEYAGHGLSSHRPPSTHYHLIDWVYDLWRLIDYLKLEQVVLLGHSMGGMLATMLASILPEKVTHLILLESAGAFTSNSDAIAANIKAAFMSRQQVKISATQKIRSLTTLPALIQARAKAGEFSNSLSELLMERNILISDDGFIWRSDPRLKTLSPIRLDESQATALIYAIEAPTLVALGKQGYSSIARSVEKRAVEFKQVDLASVEGGHHFHMQSPELTANLIINFLAEFKGNAKN